MTAKFQHIISCMHAERKTDSFLPASKSECLFRTLEQIASYTEAVPYPESNFTRQRNPTLTGFSKASSKQLSPQHSRPSTQNTQHHQRRQSKPLERGPTLRLTRPIAADFGHLILLQNTSFQQFLHAGVDFSKCWNVPCGAEVGRPVTRDPFTSFKLETREDWKDFCCLLEVFCLTGGAVKRRT